MKTCPASLCNVSMLQSVFLCTHVVAAHQYWLHVAVLINLTLPGKQKYTSIDEVVCQRDVSPSRQVKVQSMGGTPV